MKEEAERLAINWLSKNYGNEIKIGSTTALRDIDFLGKILNEYTSQRLEELEEKHLNDLREKDHLYALELDELKSQLKEANKVIRKLINSIDPDEVRMVADTKCVGEKHMASDSSIYDAVQYLTKLKDQ